MIQPTSQTKVFDALALLVWTVCVGTILWFVEVPWMVANVLLMAAPLAYILIRAPQVRRMMRWRFLAKYAALVVVFFDYLCVKYGVWGGPSLLPRVQGVTIEHVTWTVLIIPLPIAVNEYFFTRQRPTPPSTFTKPIIRALLIVGLVIAVFPPLHGWLSSYTYLKIGLMLYPIVFVLVAIVVPSALREVFLTGVVMGLFNLGFEILALHHGYWTFPGTYIGKVEVFGATFPIEELTFYILLCSAGVVATFALYKNWKEIPPLNTDSEDDAGSGDGRLLGIADGPGPFPQAALPKS